MKMESGFQSNGNKEMVLEYWYDGSMYGSQQANGTKNERENTAWISVLMAMMMTTMQGI